MWKWIGMGKFASDREWAAIIKTFHNFSNLKIHPQATLNSWIFSKLNSIHELKTLILKSYQTIEYENVLHNWLKQKAFDILLLNNSEFSIDLSP